MSDAEGADWPPDNAKAPTQVRKPSKIRVPRPEPLHRPALDPGDTIEFKMTVEVTTRKGAKFWVTEGGSTTIRTGEKDVDARDRLEQFHQEGLDRKVLDILTD